MTKDRKRSEEATMAQKVYLSRMAAETGEPMPLHLTKTEAAKKIEELERRTGRHQLL